MDLTDIALWLILIAIVALILCGCIMTRRNDKPRVGADSSRGGQSPQAK